MKGIIERFMNEYVDAKKQSFAGSPFAGFVRNEIVTSRDYIRYEYGNDSIEELPNSGGSDS